MGLDTIELVLAVEKHFDVQIPDEDASRLATVGKLHYWLINELTRLNRGPVDYQRTFLELRQLICEHADVEPEAVVPDARFVQDLRLD